MADCTLLDSQVTKPDSIGKTVLAASLIYCASNPKSGLPCAIGKSQGRAIRPAVLLRKTRGADQLNFETPRVCPACLRERSVWWAIWDLCLVAACPIHRCLLLNQCPGCKKMLARQRPAVERCRCGIDLRTVTAEVASADLVAMNTLIYRAAGFSPGAAAEHESGIITSRRNWRG